MRQHKSLVVLWGITILLAAGAVIAQTPATNLLNLRVRTDANGYLITAGGSYLAPETPLTALANLRGRTDSNGYLLTTFNGPQYGTVNGIATTSTDGVVVQNTTASTAGVPVQMSPRTCWNGTAWDTAASETTSFCAEMLPATAATPTGTWILKWSLNGAAYTNVMTVTQAGAVTFIGGESIGASNSFNWSGRGRMVSPSDGNVAVTNTGATIGSQLKVDALPTVASGFGTSPSVTAGSTPLAGSVNVGTGGVATSGVINFNGTAFPSAPFCLAGDTTSNISVRTSSTTTQLTLTVTVAWSASDVVSWLCISPK